MHALPFAYDAEALHASLLGELLILVPCYWLLTFLLISGKRGMIALRGEADALARRDPLTGIANRRALLEAIERADGPVGLLVLDVDDFKAHQHPATGIPAVTGRWCSSRTRCAPPRAPWTCRRGSAATSSRCWRPGIDAAGMEALAQRLMAEIRFGDVVRISAGWVVGAPDPSQLLLEADEALAAAKRAGKDRALSYA